MLLALAAALTLLPAAPAAALPWLRGTPASRHVPPPPAPAGLQEVAPPLGVQQLKPLLEAHQPQVRIVSPQADSLVPAGPWTLQLELSDWPLLDAGPAGLGPHLVVQLDEAPPLRLTATRVEMPPLSPGSHRLSVVAAMPWGEAMRNPGAFAQIRLHQAAANPLAGPALGTPQLIPLLPVSAAADQPLLLDWILVDAPLQHLRDGDDSWRVRISLDGDALLLDHQEALWLRGLSPGRHPLVLELLDPRGEPLNPPFNSLVRELVTSPDDRSPPWLAGPLSAASLARLSGAAPPTAAAGGAVPQAERHHDQREPRAGSATTSATGSRGRASQQKQEGAEPLPSEAEAPTPPLIAAASSTGGTIRASSGISDTSPAALGSRAPNAPAVARTPADSGSPDRIQPPLPNAEQPEQATPPQPLAPAPRREPFTSPTNTDLSAEAGAPPQERQPDADAVATASAMATASPMAESDSGTNDNALRMQADADHDGNTPDADIADVENHDQENDAVDPVAPDRLVSPAQDATPTKPPLTSPSTSKSRATQYSQAPQVAPPKESPSSAAQPFSEASALPVASPETAQPAESPRSVPPVQSPRRARSAESPASARPTPAPPPSAAAAPGSAPGEPGAAAADPPGLGPDALTIGPVLSRPGDLGEADRLISSRSVIGNVPTPSLSPRPSPPEPFDPWSSPLSIDPSARQGRDLSRSGDGKSPLERLRRWAGQ